MFYLLILFIVALIQIGILSLISVILYRGISRKWPSMRQSLFSAGTIVLLNIALFVGGSALNVLDMTVPHGYFAVYCIVLIVAGTSAAMLSASKKA